ncbi:MAG TPA: response regulator, partial [Planctomycetota bacterium]|nr:response regulator [Planctomycetota bacterium]
MLFQNVEGNLTAKQVEFARTIHSSGTDLLSLINDILDLSKIESGTMSLEVAQVRFKDLQDDVEASFRPVASSKKLEFAVTLDPEIPAALETDPKRVQQVLRNLLSNAFKFTNQGGVSLHMGIATKGWSADHEILNKSDLVLFFAVKDTGIGIPPDKHQIIFEPFQQADTSTSRKYGGTGLGLSISREVAKLLGGEIRLESTPGQGSTFTLYLPRRHVPVRVKLDGPPLKKKSVPREEGAALIHEEPLLVPLPNDITDDRANLRPGDKVLLIVEDDITFARVLLEIARLHGFKGLIAFRGETGLAMARKFRPQAISLDIRMPDMDGWALLDFLKHDSEIRHIPVQILSGGDDSQRGLMMGAFAYLRKPVSPEDLTAALGRLRAYIERPRKSLLVVEDDSAQRQSLVELLGGDDVQVTAVGTGPEALASLRAAPYDCMVLDLRLPEMSGLDLIEMIKTELGLFHLPIIVYTGKVLSDPEVRALRRAASAVIIKDAESPERLLEETSLHLHRSTSGLPEGRRKMLETIAQKHPTLSGKTVLVVDDDMRNIFALTSVLEQNDMKVVYAQDGKKAIEVLRATPGIDIILLDIMMPEMDGYEAMRQIRQMESFQTLPIVALTAKAMQGDRERCIDAGASDYIPKPVNTERLLSLLRVWLSSKKWSAP